MTVASEVYDIEYAGDGATLAFAIPFNFLSNSDIEVSRRDSTGDSTVLSTGYSITGAGTGSGTCTFTTAPASGYTVRIERKPQILQSMDLVSNDSFPAETVEAAHDRAAYISQYLRALIARCIQVPAGDGSIGDMELAPVSTRASTILGFDSAGALDYLTSIGTTVLSQAVIGGFLYPRTAAEIAAGVTPTNYAYPPGDEGRFGMVADSSTDSTSALQNLINGSAGSVPVRIRKTGSGYFKLTGRITVPANTTIILEGGAELRWTATTATGATLLGVATRPGFEVQGDNFKIEGTGTIRGPSSAAFVTNEIGIFAKGTSTSSRKSGFKIAGSIEFLNWGYAGWITQFVDDIDASGFYIHDIGHGGFFCFSCSHGDVRSFRVKNVTPGDGSSQAYGFSLTHDSTGYNVDPNIATPRLVVNPFCIDFKVHDFVIEDVPTWEGADMHGGYEVEFYNFATYNCRHGVVFGASSGDATNYAGDNNKVHHGHCTTKKRDGSATTVSATDRNGLVLKGGSVVRSNAVMADHITLDGYGDTSNTSMSVYAQYVRQAQISHITLLNWKGEGIYSADGDGIIESVIFEGVASATNSRCINIDTTTGAWNIHNCKHRPISGTAAGEGLRYASGNPRLTLSGNDFNYATTPYVFPGGEAGLQTRGASDIVPVISVSGTPTSVDISAAGRAPRVRVYFNTSGISTVADFSNAQIGQVIECYFPTTNVTTVDRTNSALAGGANFASSQYDTLVLECINTAGVKFAERSRAANS